MTETGHAAKQSKEKTMNRPTAIVLGAVLIGAGLASLFVRVRMADDLSVPLQLLATALGVAGILAGGGVVWRTIRKTPPA